MSLRNVVILSIVLALSSCKQEQAKSVEELIASRIGTTLILPDSLSYESFSDTLLPLLETRAKVIVYINGECSACTAAFSQWKAIESELSSQGDVSILYYVKTPRFKDIEWLLSAKRFTSPVFVDPGSDILYLNDIPERMALLHTILLNRKNQIVLVGSPINNPKLLELYKQQIRELTTQD